MGGREKGTEGTMFVHLNDLPFFHLAEGGIYMQREMDNEGGEGQSTDR
jgi:hypothetical protein